MSRYSSLGPVSAVTVSGSSAMPQIGQLAGADLPDLEVHRADEDRALCHRPMIHRRLGGVAVTAAGRRRWRGHGRGFGH